MKDGALASQQAPEEPLAAQRRVGAPVGQDVAANPHLHAAITRYAAANLARYRGLSLIERWLIRDMGRAALTGMALVLDGEGGLTAGALLSSFPIGTGEVSRGRARLYLLRAIANDLILPAKRASTIASDTALSLSPRFRMVAEGVMASTVQFVRDLSPEGRADLSPALAGPLTVRLGRLLTQSRALFPLDSPVRLFQDRDGGSRMLDALILLQPHSRERLLTQCQVSHSALARAGFCSRIHAIRLLRDGQALGLLAYDGRNLTIAPNLSDSVERYFVGVFTIVDAAARVLVQDSAADRE